VQRQHQPRHTTTGTEVAQAGRWGVTPGVPRGDERRGMDSMVARLARSEEPELPCALEDGRQLVAHVLRPG